MRPRLVLAILLASLASSGEARPLALRDLWRLEAVRGARAVAGGRRFLVETAAPYQSAGAFDDLALIQFELGRLHLVDPRAGRPWARPVAPGAGVVALADSPSGRRLAIGRLEHRSLRLGVLDLLNGRVRWTGLSVLPPRNGSSVVWLDERRLALLAPLGPAFSSTFPAGAPEQVRLQQDRDRQSRGALSRPRIYGSGAFAAPTPADARLTELDLVTNRRRTLATGAFDDLAAATGGEIVAMTGPAGPPRLAALASVAIGDVLPRRRLALVSTRTGVVTRPCPACDLAPTLLAWSPQGARLLIFARSDTDPTWAEGRYRIVDGESGHTRLLDPAGWRADVGQLPATRFPVVSGGWAANLPVLRLSSGEASPAAYYRLTDPGPEPVEFAPSARVGSGVRGEVLPDPGRLHARAPTDAAGLVLASVRDAQLVEVRDARGVMHLLLQRGGRRLSLMELNAHLRDVDPAAPRLLSRRASTGVMVTDRLYLPAKAGLGRERVPLIVSPYPGASPATRPETELPGSPPPEVNAQLLVGQGYAVLFPALPRLPDDEPAARTTQDVETALDGALATGLIDAGRTALWGQSFGGYAVLTVAARSTRFHAVIAQSAPTDLLSLYGAFPASARARPEDLVDRDAMLGYLEAGQGGMGAPPWRDPAKYLRNSPTFDAERIRAPVLLLDGDQDFFEPGQSEELFSALRRLDRDAQLVSLPGEGHTLTSPAEQKAWLAAALAFLHRTLAGSPAEPSFPSQPVLNPSRSALARP